MPLVEIDGMALTQTRAILSYLAAKYNLHGKDLKERVRYQSVCACTWFFVVLCQLRPCSGVAFQPGWRGGGQGTRGDALATPPCLTNTLNTCSGSPLQLLITIFIQPSSILLPLLTKDVPIK